MKTQVSRDSYKSDKRYSGVYLQQGRMVTDADWNEEAEIAKRRLDDALNDVVVSGVPRAHGLKIEAVANQALRLTRGRLYAEGVGALVTGTLADPAQPFTLAQQADFPLPDAVTPPAKDYRLYADVWERTVTSLEDPDQLRDAAFHGADTASRTQTMAQLKWCTAATDPENPAVNPPLGDAKVTLTLRRQLAGLDPCDPCASEVSVPPRIGNYLFRLEVHSVEGGPKNPTRVILKWSSENGAEQHAVGTEPADFKGSDWVYEFFTTRTEKHLGVHLAGGITPVAGELVEGFPAVPPTGFPFVRRWDGYCNLRRQGNTWSLSDGRERGLDLATDTAADADGHVSLGGSSGTLQLSTLTLDLDLTNQTFVAGDYWLAAVREAVHDPGDVVLEDAPPAGIRHHYLLLATISNTGTLVAPDTNRQQRLDFPSLTTLAARDVDYTPSCPSGLFTASHDTVQKALDRVCSIDATQVGFTKPCNTSVFNTPADIKTVAQALALLCNIKADQISYANDPACSTLTGATTVQEALHLLCLRESSGGGCRTTIGEGGEFPTLEEAVTAFKARGESRYCFCLLPGEHLLESSVLVMDAPPDKPFYFDIEGCGAASVLLLADEIRFTGFASVRFSHLAIKFIAAFSALETKAGEEAVIEGCTITIQDHDQSTPIQLAASRLVRFADNDVQMLRTSNLSIGVDVLGADASLKALFSPSVTPEKFAKDAKTAAAAIAAMTATKRNDLSKSIKQKIDERQLAAGPQNLDPDEEKALRRIQTLLPTTSQTLAISLEQALLAARQALIGDEPALAVVLAFGGGDAVVVDNRIVGTLSVYGRPGDIVLTDSQLGQIRQKIVAGTIRLQAAAEESLFLARNRIGRLRVAGDLIIKLRDIIANGGDVTGLFRTARLTENVFTLGSNDLLCVESNLTANRFAATENGEGIDSRLGSVVAQESFYVGNHGPQGFLQEASGRFNINTAGDLNSAFIHDAH
ncbi:MAG TPA: DUF6519 domain-containing protein [Thermoanaerobaculia bacterium]|jgi:hypothetical protein|nr:DUF6519 domain-containing protein [Thermoanaerobaculia bacterium]